MTKMYEENYENVNILIEPYYKTKKNPNNYL